MVHKQASYSANKWLEKIQLANRLFDSGDIEQSIIIYRAALLIAKQSFNQYKNTSPLPSGLTPSLVVSYLDLAECWSVQKNNARQIECLFEIHVFLKHALNDLSNSDSLRHQLFTGYNKVFFEMQHCLNKMKQQNLLKKNKPRVNHYPAANQAYSNTIH